MTNYSNGSSSDNDYKNFDGSLRYVGSLTATPGTPEEQAKVKVLLGKYCSPENAELLRAVLGI